MEIKVEIESTRKVAMTVEFPYYYFTDDAFDFGGGYDCAIEIQEDGSALSIHDGYDADGTQRWEIEVLKLNKKNYGGFIKPDGNSPKAKLEFERLMAKFHEFYAKSLIAINKH